MVHKSCFEVILVSTQFFEQLKFTFNLYVFFLDEKKCINVLMKMLVFNTYFFSKNTGWGKKNIVDGLYDVPVQSVNYQIQMVDQRIELDSNTEPQRETSALGLLALTYGNSSDSEEDQIEPDESHYGNEINRTDCSSESKNHCQNSALPSFKQECHDGATGGRTLSQSRLDRGDEVPLPAIDFYAEHEHRPANFKDRSDQMLDCSLELEYDKLASMESNGLADTFRDPMSRAASNCSPIVHNNEKTKFGRAIAPIENTNMSFAQRSDEDSSRMHVFCLEHAVEVEQQLRPIGGVHILLLCHPGVL